MRRNWLDATEPNVPNRTNAVLAVATMVCLCGFIALVAAGTRLAVLPAAIGLLIAITHGMRTRDHTNLGG